MKERSKSKILDLSLQKLLLVKKCLHKIAGRLVGLMVCVPSHACSRSRFAVRLFHKIECFGVWHNKCWEKSHQRSSDEGRGCVRQYLSLTERQDNAWRVLIWHVTAPAEQERESLLLDHNFDFVE
jgi:hypothetical protein